LFFETPLPADMQQTMEKWRHYIKHRELFEE
jgi:hypothetical protein